MREREQGSLVERESELAALATAAEAAASGEGRLVVVEGPAGIGKTRLLRSVRDVAVDRGDMQVLSARATELETHLAFGVVRQLLDAAIFALPEADRERLFAGAAKLARSVLFEPEVEEAAGADRYSKINGLFWLVSSLARERPLALVVDDVQWADEPSLEFLGFLARRAEDLPLLMALATRPARDAANPLSAALVAEPLATVLRPAPLSADSVETLVRDTVGSADDDFASACLEATRGNPFLLSELLREVQAQRLAPTAEAARRVGSLAPGGVSAAIELRLSQMPAASRPLAEAVAVLGDGTNASAAARVAALETSPAAEAEEGLVRGGILEEREGLCFTHPLVRATVLHGMTPSERTRLHSEAAGLLRERGASPEELATHLLHVEPVGSEDVVAHLRAAATRASQLGAPATAAAYLRRALAEPPRPELRCGVLTELGQTEARAGHEEATEHLRQAVEEATEPTARATAALELARALKFGGESVRAVDVLQTLAPDLDALDPGLRELVELEHIGLAYISQGARERLGDQIAELRGGDPGRPPATALEAFVLAGMAFDTAAGGFGSADEAADLAARAVASEFIPVDPTEGGYGTLIGAVALMFCDRMDESSRICARMTAEGQRRGSVVALSAAASMSALVNSRRGRLSEAEADCSLAVDLAEEVHGTDALLNAARAVKALNALERGAEDDELGLIEREVLDRSTDRDALPYHLVLHARGLLRMARGETDDGIADLLECGRISEAWGAHNPSVVPWRSAAAIGLARAGDVAEAKRLATEELELAERFGANRATGIALRGFALVADDATTMPSLERAVATLSDSPGTLELARALTDLAAVQRQAGRKSDARKSAVRAQELATACGATALARRAQEEALAAGARPRRVALRGVDSLTPSELRVSQRAAEGRTNREIAEDLFITVKTVEGHLANSYGKLDIRSRTELPAALQAGGEPAEAETVSP